MNYQLSKNFSLEELTVTRSQLPNVPSAPDVERLQSLVTNVLQPLRDLYGQAICVNSAFRSPAVNRAIGGASNSQHLAGEAADLEVVDNALLFNLIRNHLPFDQLIWESGNDQHPAWVHVSFRATGNRHQVLKMKVINGKKKYLVFN
ncbi:MAG: D-Ala-D-Ala carboxypeptidase family metallohydrolase [Paludibacter sp.]